MLTKTCSKCGIEKELTEFYNNPKCKLGVDGQCKACKKVYADLHREEKRQRDREYAARPEVKEKRNQVSKERYQQNREMLQIQARENYYNKITQYHEYDKQRNATEKRKEYRKTYYDKYKKENQEKLREYEKKRYLKRKMDLNYKLSQAISGGIHRCINNIKAERHWENLVCFTFEELKEHLESQFTSEMSWGNYGSYWEIDHIVPQNTFNISSSEDHDFRICWSLANLRPLTVTENRSRPKDGSDISEELRRQILDQKI